MRMPRIVIFSPALRPLAVAAAAVVFAATLLAPYVRAQDCAPPRIVANTNRGNLFSAEQEMIFGELIVQNMADEIRFIRDDKLIVYINNIGNRIASHLPATGLRFQFHLIDIPEANAFNIPGGHVLISRKLVGFAVSEQELAGVIAHELGHAVVHHAALDMSDVLKKILNISALGDRKDITEKYNLLIERARTKRVGRRSHENEQQLEADKIGLFAMVAAGFEPSAFSSFFDRLAETEGKTGNWFSDLFGKTRPEQKRLREMIRATERLPRPCLDQRAAKPPEDFLRWQADVVSYREVARKENLQGLIWKKELRSKLRSEISNFAFSNDGKLLLAQDDYSITVIDRVLLKVLFQIPIENADDAMFTPDGKAIVFTTKNLRYEKWDVAARKPIEMRELVIRRNCWEYKLSPDGSYLACVDTSTTINVLETKTGKKIWEEKQFYPLSFFEYLVWLQAITADSDEPKKFFHIQFSPDSRFVMFSRSAKHRFRFKIDMLTVAESENTAIGLDLQTLKPMNVGGELKKVAARPYTFLDSDRVLGMPNYKMGDAGIFSFPNGKRLQKFNFGAKEIKRTPNPEYVIIKPLAYTRIGVFDIKNGIVVSGYSKADATLYQNLIAYEAADGRVLLREVKYNEAQKKFDAKDVGEVEIPIASIGSLNVAGVSNNFNWLTFSSKTRGGMWNLESGERKFHLRGFKGAVVADNGSGVVDFPKFYDTQHSLVLLNPLNDTTAIARELPEKGARQYGGFVLLRSSLKPEKKQGDKEEEQAAFEDDESEGLDLQKEVRFELKDFIRNKAVWSRDFPKEAPEYSFDEYSGRLIFYWRLGSEAGKAKLKEAGELQAKAAALGNKSDDYLVEIVDAFAAKTVGMMLLETGEGSFDVGRGLSEKNWLVLHDTEGRVLVYAIKDGELRHRFFGTKAAMNPTKNQIAVENFPGELTLYDLGSGEPISKLVMVGNVAFIRFNLEGNKLLVLSNAQVVYAFDLNKLGAPTPGQAPKVQ